ICRSGQRSATACAQMKKSGFEQVYNLKGGIISWKGAGLPTTQK
ncbi:MAG: rhodanese-like domain-containing protein, partial [Thiotrichales bacterium]|nr:rhodanese-like domain-containing protein [Thiotrichales bacterium]